jgi:hypothetical protein
MNINITNLQENMGIINSAVDNGNTRNLGVLHTSNKDAAMYKITVNDPKQKNNIRGVFNAINFQLQAVENSPLGKSANNAWLMYIQSENIEQLDKSLNSILKEYKGNFIVRMFKSFSKSYRDSYKETIESFNTLSTRIKPYLPEKEDGAIVKFFKNLFRIKE